MVISRVLSVLFSLGEAAGGLLGPGGLEVSGVLGAACLAGLCVLAVPGVAGALGMLPALVDLLLPPCCTACRAPGHVLCSGCAAPLGGPGLPVPVFTRAERARAVPPVWALGEHEGVLRRLVIAHKERGRAPLAVPLGAALARLAADTALRGRPSPGGAGAQGEVWVVAVPSGRRSVRRRGRDAMGELAEAAAAELRARGRPARAVAALSRRVGTADQGGLGPTERRRNLQGAMRASPEIAGARVLLLDDVVTTGASLREACRALTAAGARLEGAVLLTSALKGRIATIGNARLGKCQESRKLTGPPEDADLSLSPCTRALQPRSRSP
ncbi:putative amidophosphoribosyltransferase [Actinocorallia herbida]|uniref:Putative amidophosphoribosyltransferase n=1 Tax=Actinocorallia herbida TaxID=58109 RepID=A0A3N1D940_9ACTN|nr:phosphoribosyltransferase family protein [Actinocorallia herbida]ROO89979.1 putative amidophosphoribosyltransferase [Actinocorallia herbida]